MEDENETYSFTKKLTVNNICYPRTIVSDEYVLQKCLQGLNWFPNKPIYPLPIIEHGMHKEMTLDKGILRKVKKKKKN